MVLTISRRRLAVALALGSLALMAGVGAPAGAQSGPVVRFFGTANQDGCSFCCGFNCQTTPTPTPEFDPQGRRVFRRSTGQFLLIVEAAPGLSNRPPGSEGVFNGGAVNGISDPSGDPSLMLLSGRNLGDGSPQVDCRTQPLGGVQGHPALDFNADVTQSLVDMACRFELVSFSDRACTRNSYGNYAFISPNATVQYCFQIPYVARFPFGDTILALQLRDVAGNLGERREIVVRVDDGGGSQATPTATPTPTPIPASIAGSLRYYTGDRAVPSATVRVSGPVLSTTTSGSTGAFTFTNMSPDTVTIEPRKIGDFGSPPAISALDAAWVLQAVAGTRVFDAQQRLTCDVTGNGSLSALDATRILQRVVGLLSRLPAADLCASDWIFEPVPGPAANQRLIEPGFSNGVCQHGGIALEPLVGAVVQQDFHGMLMGDCTGNWTPSTGGAFRRSLGAAHRVALRLPRHARGGISRAPITVAGTAPYAAAELRLRFDPNTVHVTAVRPLRAAKGATLVANLDVPGEVHVALAAAEPIRAGVPLVAVDFDGVPAKGSVRIASAVVDERPAAVMP